MNIITNILKTILDFAFGLTGDWGIAIILLTLIVRLIMSPISIKQKINMKKQQEVSKKIEAIKIKYKNNKNKLDEELKKVYEGNAKTMVGGLITLLQLPMLSGLYMTVGKLPVEAITVLVPWVISIKTYDSNFIIPIVYTLISLAPMSLSYLKVFNKGEEKPKFKIMIPMIIFNLIITIKAPIALGIYLITSSVVSLIEEIGFRIYSRNKVLHS